MRYKSAFGFEVLHVSGLSSLLKYDNAEEAWITLQGGDIRYRYDSGEPTQFEGHILHSGNSLRLHGHNQVVNFKAINCTDNHGILSATYERD